MPSSISIIIPAYNEAERIVSTLKKTLRYLGTRKERFEIIVVDDGSKDGTPQVVRKWFSADLVKVMENSSNHGKGYVVRQGMLAATGEIRLFMDADLSTPIEEIERLLQYIKIGYDVVIGSRAMESEEVRIEKSFHRYIMGKIFGFFVGLLVTGGIKDTQCGFKMFTRQAAEEIFRRQKLDGFSFDVEIVYLARKLGLKLKEIPVNWTDSQDTKIRIFRDSWAMFKDLFKIRAMHR